MLYIKLTVFKINSTILLLIFIFVISSTDAQTSVNTLRFAKTTGLDHVNKQLGEIQKLPELEPEVAPKLILPEIAKSEKAKDNKLSTMSRIFVQEFRFEGNTAFSDEELTEIAAPFTNRQITFEELQEVRHKLTLHYVNNGYITSGVIIPDQAVVDGVITLNIIEGKLTKIEVESPGRLRPYYVASRLKLTEGTPVNIKELQEMLQLLQQNQQIKSINAQFGPGTLPGESFLKVNVKEEMPYNVWFKSSNDHSPSIGEIGGDAGFSFQNIAGLGDVLSGSFGITEGLMDYDINYAIPITTSDTTLSFYFKKSESTIIEKLFENLDIESVFETYGVTLSHPFYRTPRHTLTLGFTSELRRSESRLLDRGYSFSLGEEDGKSRATVLRFFQEWVGRSQKQVIAARSTFSWGINAIDATVNTGLPDAKFMTWLGQFQWIRRLGETGFCDVIYKIDTQLTIDPLLPLEKFSVGGLTSVRGYRKNRLVRDNGVATSIEFRVPVLKNKKKETIVQLVPFFDYARSWNADSDTPDPEDIASYGIGCRWAITKKINLHVYGAKSLRKFDDEEERLQDKGIHFEFTSRLF